MATICCPSCGSRNRVIATPGSMARCGRCRADMGPVAEGGDHYETLGVERAATDDEIRRAWRRAVKRSHPDHHDGPGFVERFRAVQHAFEVLSDPRRRQAYDSILLPPDPGASSGTGAAGRPPGSGQTAGAGPGRPTGSRPTGSRPTAGQGPGPYGHARPGYGSRPPGGDERSRPGQGGSPRAGSSARSGEASGQRTGSRPSGSHGGRFEDPPVRPQQTRPRPTAAPPTPPHRPSTEREAAWKKVLGGVCALLVWWGWGQLAADAPTSSTAASSVAVEGRTPDPGPWSAPTEGPSARPVDVAPPAGGTTAGQEIQGPMAADVPYFPASTRSLMDDDAWGIGSCTVLVGSKAYPDECQGPMGGPVVTSWQVSGEDCATEGWVEAGPGYWCVDQ